MDMSTSKNAGKPAAANATPLVPPVDIIEDAEGIVVKADMPGVEREGLSVNVESEQLTIEGTVTLNESAQLQNVYAEVRVAHYRRQFVLSRELDAEKIEARLQNGVLTVRIPKAERAKPRRIEVKAW